MDTLTLPFNQVASLEDEATYSSFSDSEEVEHEVFLGSPHRNLQSSFSANPIHQVIEEVDVRIYMEYRITALNKAIAKSHLKKIDGYHSNLGPQITVDLDILLEKLAFMPYMVWPQIAPNYEGGIILIWKAGLHQVSIDVTFNMETLSVFMTPAPKEPIESLPIPEQIQLILRQIAGIHKAIIISNPYWLQDTFDEIEVM